MPRRNHNPQPALLEVLAPQPSASGGLRRLTGDQAVLQLLYFITGPLIGFPGWEDTLPQRRDEITLQRFLHHREIFEREEATDFAAMLYISTATLAAPPSHDWFEIYMWLFSRWKPDVAQEQDLKPSRADLYPHQLEDLTRLKRWLYRQQMEHLKAKLRSEGEARPEEPPAQPAAPETVQGRFF